MPLRADRIHIYLYDLPAVPIFRLKDIASYLAALLPQMALVLPGRTEFLTHHLEPMGPAEREEALAWLARAWAEAKVRNPMSYESNIQPLYGEIEYEKRRLATAGRSIKGILYDGFQVSQTLAKLIEKNERNLSNIHIIFTDQLLGTWEDSDRRYHARVSVYSTPSLISTTGLVEAPAKPRAFYLLKHQYTALGMDDAAEVGLKQEFAGQFIDYNDPRTTEVLKGYALQAIFWHLTGDPYCPDIHCRLFNAHWQEEVLKSQLGGDYDLCPTHQDMLKQLGAE